MGAPRAIDAATKWVTASALLHHRQLQDVPNSTYGAGISLATSSSNRVLWLHTLLLAASTSLGRFVLSETTPRHRAWGAWWDSNPRHLKAWNILRVLPLNYMRLFILNLNNYLKHFWLVVGGSSGLQKTSTEIMHQINNVIKYLNFYELFEVHPPCLYSPQSL